MNNDLSNFRKDFPFFLKNEDITYLDSANTSQIHKNSLLAINNYYQNYNYNISRGGYTGAQIIQKVKEQCQNEVGLFLNAKPEQIIFTSGATEGLNLIAKSFKYWYSKEKRKLKILTTKLEHASCIMPWLNLDNDNTELCFLKLNDNFTFSIDNLKKEISNNKPDIVLISSMTNTTGEIRPLKEIGQICNENNIVFIVDHAQGAAHVKIDVQEMKIDFLAFSLHKMYGPKGLGILFAKNPYFLIPFKLGGGMNKWFNENSYEVQDTLDRFYAGTENLSAICSSLETFKFFNNNWHNIKETDIYIGTYTYRLLSRLKNIQIYSIPNSTILLFNIKDNEALDIMEYLNSKKIYIRAGNHCSKLTKDLFGLSTCRISLGIYNNEEDVNNIYLALKDIEQKELQK